MKTDSVFERTYLKLMGLINEDAEVDAAAEIETDVDADDSEGNEKEVVKKVCFTTSDEKLIEALQNGVAKAVFTIAKTGEDGEETEEDVEFGGDAFGEFTVTEVCPECGEDPCVCDDGEDPEMDDGDVDDDVTESVEEEETDDVEVDPEDGETEEDETDEIEEN